MKLQGLHPDDKLDDDLQTPNLVSSRNNAVQIIKTDSREFLIGFSAFFGCFIRTIKMFQA
jgi:hypothetical protein